MTNDQLMEEIRVKENWLMDVEFESSAFGRDSSQIAPRLSSIAQLVDEAESRGLIKCGCSVCKASNATERKLADPHLPNKIVTDFYCQSCWDELKQGSHWWDLHGPVCAADIEVKVATIPGSIDTKFAMIKACVECACMFDQ